MLGVDVKGDVLLGMSLDQLSIPIDKKSKPDRGLLLKGVISLLLISVVYFVMYEWYPRAAAWFCMIFAIIWLTIFIQQLLHGVMSK